MLADALVGFMAAFGIFLLLQLIKRKLYSPLPKGENISISTFVTISGSAPELEATVKSLEHLRESGAIRGSIVLVDRGMDGETARVAEMLARKGHTEIRF